MTQNDEIEGARKICMKLLQEINKILICKQIYVHVNIITESIIDLYITDTRTYNCVHATYRPVSYIYNAIQAAAKFT